MLKNISRLEHKIGDKVYHLLCDSDSPLNEIKESLFQFLKFIGQVEDTVKAQQPPIAEVPKVTEVPKVAEEEIKPEGT